MREHEVNKLDNFIMGWYGEDEGLPDSILYYFDENSFLHTDGTVGFNQVEKRAKDSTDLILEDTYLITRLKDTLRPCIHAYMDKYEYSEMGFDFVEPINIQRYKPGGGYPGWHCERGYVQIPVVMRHLFFITYLNDVTDEGETEFFYQKTKIRPERNLTIIAPTDWTFTHRGNISTSQEKNIVTGWMTLLPTQEAFVEANKYVEQLVDDRIKYGKSGSVGLTLQQITNEV
jgi:hypothetical protein